MQLNVISRPFAPKPSVQIQNAYKRYSVDTVVLQGLNMKVPKGGIYALLGSSACGKTTVLNCIMGLTKLDSGRIRLDVDRRTRVGFMPQNLCLYTQLSIYENSLIFAYLNGMPKDRALAQIDRLIDLFELPPGERNLETLSGGQQRRVSMAIAFLHNPNIVILDEPTVGVDVNLTQVIWDYFVQQTNSGQTIILTTHYIQEAHRAHTIGMLRKGIMIAEENPQRLMARYETDSLEDIFLSLSQKQHEKKARYLSRKESRFPNEKGFSKGPYFIDDNKKISSKRMKSVLYKNVVQLSKSYAFLLTVLVAPLIQVFNFHLAFGGQPEKLKIGLVNDEIPIRDCNYTSYLNCIATDENSHLSCLYVDLLRNRTYKVKEYADEASVVRAVKKNEVWAALHFRKNYTRLLASFLANNETDTTMIWEGVKINSWVDLSSRYVGKLVKEEMLEFMKTHYRIALEQCGVSPKIIDSPGGITFQPLFSPLDNENSAATNSVVPSILIIMSVCLASTAAAMIGTEEKIAGAIFRMKAGGLSLYEFLISVFVIQIILHLIRTFLLFVFVYLVLGYSQEGSLFILVLLMIGMGIQGIQFGLVCSVLTANPTVTMISQYGFFYFIAFCAGLVWPFEGQQSILRGVNNILPYTWAVAAAQGISLRDYSVTNETVLAAFGMTAIWIIIFTGFIGCILKYKPNALISN